MSQFPRPVIMVSSVTVKDAETTLEALEAGAFDYVPKQLSSSSLNILHIREDLIRKIKAAAGSRHSLRCLDLPRKAPRAVELTPRQGSHPLRRLWRLEFQRADRRPCRKFCCASGRPADTDCRGAAHAPRFY